MSDRKPDWIEYRPNKIVGSLSVATFVITAIVLAWLGTILGPRDVDAMDGLNRLLFTAIPIPLFAWGAAIGFLIAAVAIARRTFKAQPTLVVSQEDGIRCGDELWAWDDISSIEAIESELVITVQGKAAAPSENLVSRVATKLQRGQGCGKTKKVFSSLALGAVPAEVLARIQTVQPETDIAAKTPKESPPTEA